MSIGGAIYILGIIIGFVSMMGWMINRDGKRMDIPFRSLRLFGLGVIMVGYSLGYAGFPFPK